MSSNCCNQAKNFPTCTATVIQYTNLILFQRFLQAFILQKIISNTKHLCITARKVSTKINFKFFFVEIKIILITLMLWSINSLMFIENLFVKPMWQNRF